VLKGPANSSTSGETSRRAPNIVWDPRQPV
jgi:hypothetical protein